MDGVAGWFEKRGEVPLTPPPRLREYAPLSDDPDRSAGGFTHDRIGGLACALEYCNSRGLVSTRLVRCLAIDTDAPAHLKAFCHLRGALRTFRLDRIISIADFRTGTILSADRHFALVAPYLPEHDQDPALDRIRSLRRATKDGVLALLHLAMVDGRLSDMGRECVLGYIAAEAEASYCVLPSPDLVELWIDNISPPMESVLAAVGNLLAEKDKFARLLPWLLKIVRSQETFAIQEESIRELIDEVRLHYKRKLFDRPLHLRYPATSPASRVTGRL